MPIATDTRFFDVWIVERNTVYQKVPFTVVADWLQEGRLLETDRCRPAGTTVWQKLAEHPLLLAYLPRPQPTHAEDTAEALQEIELDFPGKPREPEDDDVDMIPLIDISMVLLVFFMMTAQNLMTSSSVNNPKAKHAAQLASHQGLLNVIMKAQGTRIEYYVGEMKTENMLLDAEECAKKVASEKKIQRVSKVILQADETIPYEKVQDLTIKLERAGIKGINAKVNYVGAHGSVESEGGPSP